MVISRSKIVFHSAFFYLFFVFFSFSSTVYFINADGVPPARTPPPLEWDIIVLSVLFFRHVFVYMADLGDETNSSANKLAIPPPPDPSSRE